MIRPPNASLVKEQVSWSWRWWVSKVEEENDKYTKWMKRKTVFRSHVLKMDNKINSPVICVHLCVYTESVWLSARDDEPVSWRMCVHYREYVCVYKVFHTSTVPATLYYNSWSDFTFLKAGFTPQHLWSNATFLKWDFLYHYTTAPLVKCYIFKRWLYRIIIRALLVNCYIFENWFYTITIPQHFFSKSNATFLNDGFTSWSHHSISD